MTDELTFEELSEATKAKVKGESAQILQEALKQIEPIVQSRRLLAEQEQSIQGAIVKLTSVIEELQNQFSAFKAQKNVNAELEREVLGKIKSKLGE